LQQNFNSNAAATTANTDSPQVVENLRTKTQSWNSQNLKMLLSDNRLTPTEFSKLIPNLESSRVLQSIKVTSFGIVSSVSNLYFKSLQTEPQLLQKPKHYKDLELLLMLHQ